MAKAQGKKPHPALDEVVELLTNADSDLTGFHLQLHKEFHRSYRDQVNPAKLVARVKKVVEDVAVLKEQCHRLLVEKQELIDTVSITLITQKNSLQRLRASCDLPDLDDSDNMVYANFDQVINEWKAHVGLETGIRKDGRSKDVNSLFFSTVV